MQVGRTADVSAAGIIARCQELFEDIDFNAVRAWKDSQPGRKVVGYMPFYVPREILHAGGILPVGILGGGDQIEVIHGDAYYQSYICRIPRSTIELGLTGRLDVLDGMLFPSLCDVIRNLSGMWKLMFKDKYVRYFDMPQNFEDDVGGAFYLNDLRELRADLEALAGRKITDESLRASILAYNENRRLVNDLYALRGQFPWKVSAADVYLILRAGMVLPVEEHSDLVRDYIAAVAAEERPMRDNCRIVLCGAFCEQPPLTLIRAIELAGCYIVNDDFMLVTRWLLGDVPVEGDPLAALVAAYLHDSTETAAKYTPDKAAKGAHLVETVRRSHAEGVIFAAPSFCDPALLDQPMLQSVLADHGIPFTDFKYAENAGQMQPIREQAGTFADSIKLWSAA